MATKKDLVEAQSFSKRRLTTAFVSGAPGGREVEPDRPLRAVVGGLALTVVLVLGSLAFGWLRSSLPDDWGNDRLVIAEDSGARYVAIKERLHPVVNTTSARLLIPADRFKVLAVPDEELADIKRGATLGILGAPDSLTTRDRLVNTGWISCLGAGQQVSTAIGANASARPAGSAAVLVRSGDATFVIGNGMRYPVAPRDLSAVSVALRLDGRPALAAPAAWLNLFPEGTPLTPLRVDDLGKPLSGLPSGATVGSVLRITSDGRHYLVTPRGTLEPLPDVALAMYRLGSGASGQDVPATSAQIGRLQVEQPRTAPSDWPDRLPTVLETTPCATLTAAAGTAPVVTLGTVTKDPPADQRGRTVVDTGSGALVRAVSGAVLGKGPVLAVDQTATAYAIDGADAEVLARLGYAADDVVPVPVAWTELFRSGPSLGTAAARTVVSGTS
ncbi:type VII secretion protein EccB [Phycicoccus sonneratiae]|uniref:Type VII secretion protein EccB n=1 Tax=Phycicoccus sonneratiae TaxID=2807628 RepID=A0ABS2CIZ2_9MICO|nr:type VII secretion protein EccB [Phycicoccus sonneraticus]MBM6399054.1 type VII secretion protein EccB [Phycicoccus sonneraticus]